MKSTATIDELALAVLAGSQLDARAIAAELDPSAIAPPRPESGELVAIVAAGLAELLAEYAGVPAPEWASLWGASPEPVNLIPARTERLRRELAKTAPEPLRRRNILAPEGFLRAV